MVRIWNKNFFDWCWNCFNMGMKLYVSETWTQDNPGAAEYSKVVISELQKTDQSKYNYFSRQGWGYKMVIPGIAQNKYISYLIPGFLFLIKEHINHQLKLVKWKFKKNTLVICFKLA